MLQNSEIIPFQETDPQGIVSGSTTVQASRGCFTGD